LPVETLRLAGLGRLEGYEVDMALYTYIITHDSGFAPNPFWGYCTIACCKPRIRRGAGLGDWTVGLRGRSLFARAIGGRRAAPDEIYRIIFAMQVRHKMTFTEYFEESRFGPKRPDYSTLMAARKRGDNIYEPLADGTFRQLRSRHSQKDGMPNLDHQRRDLNGKYVLVSGVGDFWYFGRQPLEMLPSLTSAIFRRAAKWLP
jgi:hypothetical protein